jgi:hypothetical protein
VINNNAETAGVGHDFATDSTLKIRTPAQTGDAAITALDGTFSGSIAIANTVAASVATPSTHKVTISIGGSTYYLLATNV